MIGVTAVTEDKVDRDEARKRRGMGEHFESVCGFVRKSKEEERFAGGSEVVIIGRSDVNCLQLWQEQSDRVGQSELEHFEIAKFWKESWTEEVGICGCFDLRIKNPQVLEGGERVLGMPVSLRQGCATKRVDEAVAVEPGR